MTWKNYGKDGWEIDHFIPIKYRYYEDIEPTKKEIIKRLDWFNCQPLWWWQNKSKGCLYIG